MKNMVVCENSAKIRLCNEGTILYKITGEPALVYAETKSESLI